MRATRGYKDHPAQGLDTLDSFSQLININRRILYLNTSKPGCECIPNIHISSISI